MNLLALKHISQLAKTFQVKVMITEIGVKQNDSASAQVLADFINKARDMESCAGVWYWEPECYEWNGYDMGAFDKNGKPTAIMNNRARVKKSILKKSKTYFWQDIHVPQTSTQNPNAHLHIPLLPRP